MCFGGVFEVFWEVCSGGKNEGKTIKTSIIDTLKYTPGSMNSLFSDFSMEFWRGILGGVRTI